MRQAKKLISIFACLILSIMCFSQVACATENSTRASHYLTSYGATLYADSSNYTGTLNIEFDVVATQRSDYVGVSELIIYKSNGSRVATITGSTRNGLLCADTVAHAYTYSYNGTPGTSYYAVLTMYAERDGGSDSRTYTTNTCVAPGNPPSPSRLLTF